MSMLFKADFVSFNRLCVELNTLSGLRRMVLRSFLVFMSLHLGHHVRELRFELWRVSFGILCNRLFFNFQGSEQSNDYAFYCAI